MKTLLAALALGLVPLSAQAADGTEKGARELPGGYAKITASLNKGVTLWHFKFVEKGKTSGMAFDGLVFVNGHWVIFPKPWRALAK